MKNRGGFTIVEAIIVLAVSTIIFLSMILMFSGRQSRIEFSQGIRDIESYIRATSNDVRNGYYPSPNQKCSVASDTLSFSEIDTAELGKNSNCIFIGKALLINNTSGFIESYSIAGDRLATVPENLKPTLIGRNGTETKQIYKLPVGISLINTSGDPIFKMIGLLTDINTVSEDGSVSIRPQIFKNVTSGSIDELKLNIKNIFSTDVSLQTTNEIRGGEEAKLCFKGGSINQNAIIFLSRVANGISTRTLINQNLNTTGC